MPADTISVVGLGKLGAPMVACLASKGFPVIGVDVDARAVETLAAGRTPVHEPGLAELIARHRGRIAATTDLPRAVLDSSITFVVVATPSVADGSFDLRYAREACREIGQALARKADYHLVVLTSTVLPGSIEQALIPVLEAASGKRAGADFGVCYNPEFIALGTVIRDFLNPDLVLIGEVDARAGERLAACYPRICDNAPPVARMNLVSAELAKIAINTYVTTKITFANMLSELCERLPGANVDAVASALGLDSRIGPRYLKGGLGYGGPCFPRDNLALAHFARDLGGQAQLAEVTDAVNRGQVARLLAVLEPHLPARARVAVLGLSYKPGTVVVQESQGLEIARRLARSGHDVVACDPVAVAAARSQLGERVAYATAFEEAVADADALVIANPDPAFASLGPDHLRRSGAPVVVLDCWRGHAGVLSQQAHVRYLPVGVGPPAGRPAPARGAAVLPAANA